MLYQYLIQPALFSLDAEAAHNAVFGSLKLCSALPGAGRLVSKLYSFEHPALESNLLGIKFKNPVGLAAGFDKNADLLNIIPSFGFGFVEAGTITAKEQPGNPKPRLFRLKEDEALINRLGFNNSGARAVEDRLKSAGAFPVPVGINIGKSKATELEKAAEDYVYSFERLYPFAAYFTINVSSPNTPGLRTLQHQLSPLLSALQKKNSELAKTKDHPPKPIFVKVAPDLELAELDRICENCIQNGVSGIVATNTTLSRDGLKIHTDFEGGLSGRPLAKKSAAFLRHIRKNFGAKLVLVGVGGIFGAEDAYEKIKAGASLVQIYTGWVYRGPSLIREINIGLVKLLRRDGFMNIQDAIGVEI